uniref:Uncharacterized protein n=1 Tax=Anguilla anguilla TaxID=7936 RepID=A0A0E9QHN9_ANGAN
MAIFTCYVVASVQQLLTAG